MHESATRAGTVALVGLPNAGKSSLLNQMLETKLSIVTPLAQTTRERVVGIDTRDGVQMVFLDTPGIVRPSYLLHHALVSIVAESLADADVVVLVVDGTRGPPELDDEVLAALHRVGSGLVVVINKVDVAAETAISGLVEWSERTFSRVPMRVSAESGAGVADLRAAIAERLPESPFLYPDDELSSQPVRFFVAEMVRETVFEQFLEEVPYSVAVRIEEFREAETPVFIRAVVLVERPSQKAILIGKGGSAIRALGTAARRKIEEFVGSTVYLELWVKVLPKWRKSPLELKRLGFPVPDEKQQHA